jgi:hypothetical protein
VLDECWWWKMPIMGHPCPRQRPKVLLRCRERDSNPHGLAATSS